MLVRLRSNASSTLIFTGILVISMLLMPLASYADSDSHSTRQLILQYGPDGGITFSVWAKVSSVLNYQISTSGIQFIYEYTLSDASILVPLEYSYGIESCGSTLDVKRYTNFGSENVYLNQVGEYLVRPGDTIVGYRTSPSSWYTRKVSPFSVNVKNEGYVLPSPSKCYGGGNVIDSFTINH